MKLWNKQRKAVAEQATTTKDFIDHIQNARKLGAKNYRETTGLSSAEAMRLAPTSITKQDGYVNRKDEFSTAELESRIDLLLKAVENFELPE